jgi:hypothetical protein
MVVEKIKRDVKITQIYEGTNEILEITIARSRWQEHLKSRGAYFNELAKEAQELHSRDPDVGSEVAAYALKALANIFEECRSQKLTRNQHIMMRLGELAAWGETAMVFSRMAAEDNYSKAVKFDHETWKAMSRVNARDSALKVAHDGIKLIMGYGQGDPQDLRNKMFMDQIMAGQKGQSQDQDMIAQKLKSVFKMT